MSGAIIAFYPNDGLPAAQGVADDEGEYQLTTYYTGDGAVSGEHKITVYWPIGPTPEPSAADPDPPLSADRLKHAYADRFKTTLTRNVADQPNIIDFELP
jgi:hypothetical protein